MVDSKLAIFISAAMAVALSTPSSAQLTQCSGVAGGTNYKVLIDEVRYATGSSNQPALAIELIQNAVEGALEKVRRGLLVGAVPGGTISYLNCSGRYPKGLSEFDNRLVKSMAANHAILELWGTLLPLDETQHQFEIRYVMFPVAAVLPHPAGTAATTRMLATKPTASQVRNYLAGTRADLPIYFTVAVGAQAYADRHWDQAVRFLCEARTRLRDKADQQDLMRFADSLASKAAAEIRRVNNTAAGLLTDAQARNYCMFATSR